MFTDTETAGKSNGKGVRGRKDSQGIEKQPRKVSETKLKDLDHLALKKIEARETYNDSVKATAKAHGVSASALNKLIAARIGDDFDDRKREVEQLAFAFGVVSEVSAPAETEEAEAE